METEGVIRQLDPTVIAKIAAGEVVLRPAAAIKELVENSIDAGARTITLELAKNPLEYAQVTDDGSGVSVVDMVEMCKRFSTSKTHDSITGIKSFGFRGEALAALSHAANVTISSRTIKQERRYRLKYRDGEPCDGSGQWHKGDVGTTVTYENLFFNMTTREKALGLNATVEYNMCLELIQKYAVHFPDIKFVFHRVGSSTYDVNSLGGNSSTGVDSTGGVGNTHTVDGHNTSAIGDYDYRHFNTVGKFPPDAVDTPELVQYREQVGVQNTAQLEKVKKSIEVVYGTAVARALYTFQCWSTGEIYYNCKGLLTHPGESNRCHSFILFINNRLVDHAGLRKMIDQIYKELVHKKQRRFVYLSIYMPYERIDANVHPSKEKVYFQYQDEIVQEIGRNFKEQLEKIMQVNTESTSAYSKMESMARGGSSVQHLKRISAGNGTDKLPAKCRVRSDYRQRDIPSFVIPRYIQESRATGDVLFRGGIERVTEGGDMQTVAVKDEVGTQLQEDVAQPAATQHLGPGQSVMPKLGNIDFSFMDLANGKTNFSDMWNIPFIKRTIEEWDHSKDDSLTQVLVNSVLVGPVDRRYIILQHETKLYMVDIVQIARECAYQSVIWRIGQLPRILLSPGLCIVDVLSYALGRNEYQNRGCVGIVDKQSFRAHATKMVETYPIEILTKYFGFTIENRTLIGMPKILSNYFPGYEYIPGFVLQLFSVDTQDETRAVSDIARVIAEFYTLPPVDGSNVDQEIYQKNYEHYLTKVLLRAVQKFPDLSLSKNRIDKGAIIKLAELDMLYRIFERC
ncbi:DNA mismatch repair protein [Babesia ovis]|uniref:DNA mismatch repair protein n=1 Tax=Babesia ovis TaxID=5869 RepID=A0A9W5TCM5_BABOV|nr:DNA mismatch repair protein [Babesia ovis]